MSAEAQLMTRMAEFDLRPPEILFDHKLHRFKAGGDKGTHRSGSGRYHGTACASSTPTVARRSRPR